MSDLTIHDEKRLQEDYEVEYVRILWSELREDRMSKPKIHHSILQLKEQNLIEEMGRASNAIGKSVYLCPCGDVFVEKTPCKSCQQAFQGDFEANFEEDLDFDPHDQPFFDPFAPSVYEGNVVDLREWIHAKKRNRGRSLGPYMM